MKTETRTRMPTRVDSLAQLNVWFELENGLSRLGRAHAGEDTLECIAGAFLAKNFVGDLFGRLAQQTGVTELARHREPTLGFVRVHRRGARCCPHTPLHEHILAAGGAEFCDSREALLAGYLKRGEYLVLYLDVHRHCQPPCAADDADGVGDAAGLLAHPQTVNYAEFMQRMCQKPLGWSGGFSLSCCFLPPDQPLPMRVEVVSWQDIELCAPDPPMPVVRAGAPKQTRRLHMQRKAMHFWTCLFQGNTILQRNIERIRALYAIVVVDLFDHGALSESESHALTGVQPRSTGKGHEGRAQLLEAISTCQVAPVNVCERNYHTWVEAYDETKKRYIVIEPAKTLFPHARFSHTCYKRARLEQLAPGIYAKLEPSQELCKRMQAGVEEMRTYLATAQASDDPDGQPVTFTGAVPLELHCGLFKEMEAVALDGSSCTRLTRYLLAYMRAWGYRARAVVGSLTVRLPGRENMLLYGTGRPRPENLRDVWERLVARHAGIFPERGADVQRILAAKIGVGDYISKMYPEHLLRWARPASHMLLPMVLPPRCEGCGGGGGKLMRCARCRLVHYCSRACQLAHHSTHGPVCRRVIGAVRKMQEVDTELVRAPEEQAAANRRLCA
jgi:hypothetical protein